MKIGNPADKPVPVAPSRSSGSEASKSASTAPAASSDEQTTVALSSAAAQLLAGEDAVSSDFDTAKVSRIAQAISHGNYKINAEVIADKLLANAKEVLGELQH